MEEVENELEKKKKHSGKKRYNDEQNINNENLDHCFFGGWR